MGKTAGWPLFLPTRAALITLDGKTVCLPTHRDKSLPNPLRFTELCRDRSLTPSLARRDSTQCPTGIRTASWLMYGVRDFAR